MPLAITKGQANVMIGGKPAARVTDQTAPCMLAGDEVHQNLDAKKADDFLRSL